MVERLCSETLNPKLVEAKPDIPNSQYALLNVSQQIPSSVHRNN